MPNPIQLLPDIWTPAIDEEKIQALILLAKLPARTPTDLDMVKAVYLIALDGVTRYALEKATRKILQGALGHPFMPSPPELRIECDRIMQPHQDYLRTIVERKRRMAWDEDRVRTEPPPDAAKQRTNALWAAVRPMFEKPKPTQTPAEPETEANIVARLSAGWTHPDPRLFETIHMTKGRD